MTTDDKELLEVVDQDGNVVGLAERSELHGNPSLIHRVVHVLVFNSRGELLLQKRSQEKDVAPGRWDTSVGGHVNPGEDMRGAALREMGEELGITGTSVDFLYSYIFTDRIESELTSTFSLIYDGDIKFNGEEIDEVRYWNVEEIKENLGKDIFSSHFEKDIRRYLGIEID